MIIVRQRGTRFRAGQRRRDRPRRHGLRHARRRGRVRRQRRAPLRSRWSGARSGRLGRRTGAHVPGPGTHRRSGRPRRRRRRQLPPREVRSEGRPRRRRRRPRRGRHARRGRRPPRSLALPGKSRFRAERGRHGQGGEPTGADGEDVELAVPVGTQVLDADGRSLADLAHAGARVVRRPRRPGRRGQPPFASPTRQAPRVAEPGLAGRGAARAPPQAGRRRRAARLPERRQVVPAAPHLERDAQGRRVPVHDGRAGARHGRGGRRAPARRGRRAGPAGGCEPRESGWVTSSSPISSAHGCSST